MLVTRLAGTGAEGLGLAFAITEQAVTSVVERTWELERVLQRLAWEIEATGVLAGLKEPPATTNLVALVKRSQEVASRYGRRRAVSGSGNATSRRLCRSGVFAELIQPHQEPSALVGHPSCLANVQR